MAKHKPERICLRWFLRLGGRNNPRSLVWSAWTWVEPFQWAFTWTEFKIHQLLRYY